MANMKVGYRSKIYCWVRVNNATLDAFLSSVSVPARGGRWRRGHFGEACSGSGQQSSITVLYQNLQNQDCGQSLLSVYTLDLSYFHTFFPQKIFSSLKEGKNEN